jgi:hypothetical protein
MDEFVDILEGLFEHGDYKEGGVGLNFRFCMAGSVFQFAPSVKSPSSSPGNSPCAES